MSRKAFCLLNLSRYEEAVEIYVCLIERIPNNKKSREWLHQIHCFKGAAFVELDRYEEAIAR